MVPSGLKLSSTLILKVTSLLNTETVFRLACYLPHCCYIPWSPLAISELQLSVAMPFWPFHRATSLQSWTEVNCLWSANVGKTAGFSINWLDPAYRMVFPLRQMALVQLYKYLHQSGELQASLKAALLLNTLTYFKSTKAHILKGGLSLVLD